MRPGNGDQQLSQKSDEVLKKGCENTMTSLGLFLPGFQREWGRRKSDYGAYWLLRALIGVTCAPTPQPGLGSRTTFWIQDGVQDKTQRKGGERGGRSKCRDPDTRREKEQRERLCEESSEGQRRFRARNCRRTPIVRGASRRWPFPGMSRAETET
eukprot:3941736-Rhodomonas_salina.1